MRCQAKLHFGVSWTSCCCGTYRVTVQFTLIAFGVTVPAVRLQYWGNAGEMRGQTELTPILEPDLEILAEGRARKKYGGVGPQSESSLLFFRDGSTDGVSPICPHISTDKKAAITAAFIARFGIGFVIGAARLPWPGWAVGLCFGLLLSVPDALITKAYGPMIGMGAIGGTIIGIVVGRFGR